MSQECRANSNGTPGWYADGSLLALTDDIVAEAYPARRKRLFAAPSNQRQPPVNCRTVAC